MNDAEEQAEQAVDLFEEHVGWMMPDTSYNIEIGYDQNHAQEYGEHGVPIGYELEATIPGEDGGIDSEFEFSGGHLLYGDLDDMQTEYEALVNEFDSRYEDSTVEAESWEDIADKIEQGENAK